MKAQIRQAFKIMYLKVGTEYKIGFGYYQNKFLKYILIKFKIPQPIFVNHSTSTVCTGL